MIFISEYFIIRGPFICGFEWKEKCQGSGRKRKAKKNLKKNKNIQKKKGKNEKHEQKTEKTT